MNTVDRRELTRADPPAGPVLGDSRAQVLAALQSRSDPVSVLMVARQVGLHPNTARFHLDHLVEQGLAARETEQRDAPGRPRTLYRASSESTRTGRRSYRLLAEILTSYLSTQTPQASAAAEQAGKAWGKFLTDRPAPFREVDTATAIRQLTEVLDDIGFAPQADTGPSDPRILLHHCPFREVAEEHPDVACAVHLGLMRGVLSELKAPVEATALEPFVEPNLCVARLAERRPEAG
ncbi:helix-turn-helix transcriptional regulator [Flexivirga alba]|uniref:Helix-turn-helix transcriptional regulator n=1 Tax=Flexivirga alba TaxID=702742 RepID=A0ABW2AAG1_9MICO